MSYKKRMARLLSLVLCFVFLFSACSIRDYFEFILPFDLPGESAQTDPEEKQRRTVPFSEMKYERPDASALVKELDALTENIRTSTSFKSLWDYDEEATRLTEDYMTMYNLAELQRYLNINDPYYQEEYRYCKENTVRVSSAINQLNLAIIESPYAAEYEKEVGSYVFESIQNDLLLNSTEVEELKEKISGLQADYNEDLSTLTVEYEGTAYTMTDLSEMDDQSLAYLLEEQFNEEYADHFANILIQLIDLQNETTSTLGFESAAEMFYLAYSRDYTPEDALALCEAAKAELAPLAPEVLAGGYYPVQISEDEALGMMPSALRRIDPAMEEAFDFMEAYDVYDFGARSEKQSGVGFTTDLYSYDTAYIYGFWQNDLRSATTLFHEFGHFFDSWLHWDETIVFNLDLSETYSQGLELLMQRFFTSFDGEWEGMVASHLSDTFQSITYQALLEELQLTLYEEETLDAQTISRIYTQLLVDYGYGDYAYSDAEKDWVQITHLFEAPFYTISYATSACVALQIWEASSENWKDGAELYMSMIESDQNQPFLTVVNDVELRSPFEPAVLQDIAASYEQLFQLPQAA